MQNILGMTFNRTVNLKYSQKVLVQQSIKARAVLEGYLRKHKHLPVNVIFDLFDTLIKPILLYACEVWGITMGNDIEQLHLTLYDPGGGALKAPPSDFLLSRI